MQYRRATADDAQAIAGVHADSWRRSYRGAYSDAFLDGDVFDDRLSVWTARLQAPRADHRTIVAEHDGRMVGFAHTALDEDETWGALLDNLHVRHEVKGLGIGTRLMAEVAAVVLEERPSSGVYLWVLQHNTPAQAFYDARGGKCVGADETTSPAGDVLVALRYAWPDPARLLLPL